MVPGTTSKRPVRRKCQVCRHDLVATIDDHLSVPRVNVAGVARHFGIPYKAMQRHRDDCLPARRPIEVQQSVEIPEPAAEDVAGQVSYLISRSRQLLDRAERAGSVRDVAAAMRECRGNIETMAKLAREIDQAARVNVFASPSWLKVQGRIVAALDDHPDAQMAVLRALETPGTLLIE